MTTVDTHRPLLTVRETAERLRVSELTVRRLIQTGELVAYQLGGKGRPLRIDAAEFEAWLRGESEEVEILKRQILQAVDRGDDEELERLRARYREVAMLERPMPAPELRDPRDD